MGKKINSIRNRIMRMADSPFLKSMRTKLTLSYLLLTLVPIVIITVFVFNVSIATLKNEVSAYVSNTLEQANKNIDNTFVQLSNMSASIGLNSRIQQILKSDAQRPIENKMEDDEAAAEIIKNATINFRNIESLFLFSYNGEVYSLKGATNSLPTDYNFTRQNWFEKMKQLGKRSLIIPTHSQMDVIGEGKSKKVFSYISEINDLETQKNIGYLMFEIDISVFDTLLQSISPDELSQLIIIDNNKTVIYHTLPVYITTQYRTNYVSEMLEKGRGYLSNRGTDGEEIINYDTSGSTGWTVVSVMPSDILYSRINSFELALIFTIALCLISAIVIAILMSSTLTEPISLLKSKMKLVESGDFDTQIKVKSKDEIGELSLSFNKMLAQIKQLIQRVYQTEIVRKEAELSALQAQINPHFLYNTLQIMDIMAEEKGADEISGACQALARIFRYSISKGKELVPLEKEIIHVKNYVFIQRLRLGDKLSVEYHIDDALLRYEIIKLILQPLVENAIIHGIEKNGKSCLVKVSAQCVRDNLILTVEDDGIGMTPEELAKLQNSLYQDTEEERPKRTGGIALKNVNDRIRLYHSDKFGMSIQSKKHKGTKVTLVLPARLYVQSESEECR